MGKKDKTTSAIQYRDMVKQLIEETGISHNFIGYHSGIPASSISKLVNNYYVRINKDRANKIELFVIKYAEDPSKFGAVSKISKPSKGGNNSDISMLKDKSMMTTEADKKAAHAFAIDGRSYDDYNFLNAKGCRL